MLSSKRFGLMITIPVLVLALLGTPKALESNATPLQQLYMMKQLFPKTQTVGIMWNQSTVNTADLMPKIQRAAAAVGVKVVIADVEELKDIAQKFRDLTDNYHIQILWILQNDNMVGSSLGRDYLIKNATVNGIAVFAPNTDWVSAGACATLLNEGSDVKLIVNQKTLNALGIKVPEKYIPNTQFLATN